VTARRNRPVKRALAVLAAGVGLGVAPVSGSLAGAAGGATPAFSHAPAIAALAGTVVYLANPHSYEAGATQTLVLSTLTGLDRKALFSVTDNTIGLVCFSPDGSRIAYFRGTKAAAAIDVMNLSTGRVTSPFKLGTKAGFITGLAWSADGTNLIVGSNEPPQSTTSHAESALWRVPAAGGHATRITPYADAGSPAITPNGALVYVMSKTYSSTTYKKSTMWVANLGGHLGVVGTRQIASSSHFISGLSASPNGQTIAFSITTDAITSHLEAVGVGGGAATALTRLVSGRSDLLPTWSPDGSHLLFLSSRAGRIDANKDNQLLDVYVMKAIGTDITKVIWFSNSTASVDLAAWDSAAAEPAH